MAHDVKIGNSITEQLKDCFQQGKEIVGRFGGSIRIGIQEDDGQWISRWYANAETQIPSAYTEADDLSDSLKQLAVKMHEQKAEYRKLLGT